MLEQGELVVRPDALAQIVEQLDIPGMVAMASAVGVLCLLVASTLMWREVSLAVTSFDDELDQELARRRG